MSSINFTTKIYDPRVIIRALKMKQVIEQLNKPDMVPETELS